MNSMHDPDRLIRAFLDEGQTELPARTYDAVRDHIERTRQRVVIGPWREPDMSNIARIAVAAAAVLVVAVGASQIMPREGGSGGEPSPTPSISPSASASASASPASLTTMTVDAPFPARVTLRLGSDWVLWGDVGDRGPRLVQAVAGSARDGVLDLDGRQRLRDPLRFDRGTGAGHRPRGRRSCGRPDRPARHHRTTTIDRSPSTAIRVVSSTTPPTSACRTVTADISIAGRQSRAAPAVRRWMTSTTRSGSWTSMASGSSSTPSTSPRPAKLTEPSSTR